MSAAATTYFKLGLFAIAGALAVVAAAFGLGLHRMKPDTITFHTYFDESVQGLELGAPVRYRGVPIGTVKDIDVAPDRKHVDVSLSIEHHQAQRLGVAKHPDLRAQLASQGITGVKLVNIDFVDPRIHPLPELGFEPDPNYIPSAPSLMKSLEDSLAIVLQQLPPLLKVAVNSIQRVETILGELQGEQVPQRLGKAIDGVNAALVDARALLGDVSRSEIPDKTAKAIDELLAAIARVNATLDSIGGENGLVASTKRAADSIGSLGRSPRSAQDFDQTLRHIDEAAQAIRDLMHSVERDPDMLLKGHSRGKLR